MKYLEPISLLCYISSNISGRNQGHLPSSQGNLLGLIGIKSSCFYFKDSVDLVKTRRDHLHATYKTKLSIKGICISITFLPKLLLPILGAIQKIHNCRRGEGVDDFIIYRYVYLEGEGGTK